MFSRLTWFIFVTFSGAHVHLQTVSIFSDMDVRAGSQNVMSDVY